MESKEKRILDNVVKWIVFALPGYGPAVPLYHSLARDWSEFLHSDLLALALIIMIVIAAAVFLLKGWYWVSLPMMVLGAYITTQNHDPFLGLLIQFYGIYFVLHYLMCGVYAYKHRKKEQP